MPEAMQPLTCQWCSNSPASQVAIVDWPAIGRRISLVCDPCGDGESDATRVGAMVWRYRLTPIKEAQSA